MKNFLEIRNIGIKTFLMILGLIAATASVYHSVLFAFLLTENQPEKEIYWELLIVGFFLAIGAAFYNKVADAIATLFNGFANKFNSKK